MLFFNSQGRWEDKEYLVFRDQEGQRGQGDKRVIKVSLVLEATMSTKCIFFCAGSIYFLYKSYKIDHL